MGVSAAYSSVSARPSVLSSQERQGHASRPEALAQRELPRDRVSISPEAREAAARATGALDDEARTRVRELMQTDAHVRAHEAAHQAAGGALAGAASFTLETGPDGRQYAVAGEVPIRLETGRTPEETLANAQRARSAALAPADPSPQDLAVAAAATQLEVQARQQQQALQAQEADPARAKHRGVALYASSRLPPPLPA